MNDKKKRFFAGIWHEVVAGVMVSCVMGILGFAVTTYQKITEGISEIKVIGNQINEMQNTNFAFQQRTTEKVNDLDKRVFYVENSFLRK